MVRKSDSYHVYSSLIVMLYLICFTSIHRFANKQISICLITNPLNCFCSCFHCCGDAWSSQMQTFQSTVTQKPLKSLMAQRVSSIMDRQTNTQSHTQNHHRDTSVLLRDKTQNKWQQRAMLWCHCPWLIALISFSSCIPQTTLNHSPWSQMTRSTKNKTPAASWELSYSVNKKNVLSHF